MVSLPGLKTIIDSMSRERKLPKQAVQNALTEALLKGYERYRRQQTPNHLELPEDYFNHYKVELDLETEGFRVFATKTVVETVNDPEHEITPAMLSNSRAKLGETVVVDVTPDQKEFGRVAALQTKQVLTQKLQEHRCQFIKDHFQELRGTVLPARVVRQERKATIVAIKLETEDMEIEAELPNYERMHADQFPVNSHIKVYLKKVYDTPRHGPQLRVSRATTGLVAGMLTNLVPEIQQEIVEIKAIVRDSTPLNPAVVSRSKIAVATQESELDPVAVCWGENGSHLEQIAQELHGEMVDILPWSEDPVVLITNALKPAMVEAVKLLEAEEPTAQVIVPADQMPIALGPDEQNLRLASRLTGWKIELVIANC